MVKRVKLALVERRPWLLLSLFFGITWIFLAGGAMPGLYQVFWKGAAVAFLAVYAFQRHIGRDGMLVAAMMALSAAGDAISTLEYLLAGVFHAASHVVAITLWLRNRRESVAGSQAALAIVILLAGPFIAWALTSGTDGRWLIVAYSALLATMVALAWISRFHRYRVGIGAVLYLASDLVLIAAREPLRGAEWALDLVWPLYYVGQLLIVTGVIVRLRAERA